jgi:hypothetical protein
VREALSRVALVAACAALPACVDAPIDSQHLQPNGELRQSVYEQAGFTASAERTPVQVQHVSAVLAAESEGALEDRDAFTPDVGIVHLHLRADGLVRPRPVIFRWSHDDRVEEVLGVLAPSDAMSLAASHPISRQQEGTWRVEVLDVPLDGGAAPVLFERTFQVSRSLSE